MCTPFRWASLGSALSWGPWGTDAQNSTVAMPWLRSRSKKVAEMVMESHWVPRKKQSQEHREEEMEGRAGRCWRMDGWTGQSQDGTPGYRMGGVLLTDVTTEGAAPGAWQAGPRPAHLSLPFWMEAWPRLALSRSGEFLLRFVLVERTLFCGEEGEELYHRNPKWSQIQLPSSLSTISNGGGSWGEERMLL